MGWPWDLKKPSFQYLLIGSRCLAWYAFESSVFFISPKDQGVNGSRKRFETILMENEIPIGKSHYGNPRFPPFFGVLSPIYFCKLKATFFHGVFGVQGWLIVILLSWVYERILTSLGSKFQHKVGPLPIISRVKLGVVITLNYPVITPFYRGYNSICRVRGPTLKKTLNNNQWPLFFPLMLQIFRLTNLSSP